MQMMPFAGSCTILGEASRKHGFVMCLCLCLCVCVHTCSARVTVVLNITAAAAAGLSVATGVESVAVTTSVLSEALGVVPDVITAVSVTQNSSTGTMTFTVAPVTTSPSISDGDIVGSMRVLDWSTGVTVERSAGEGVASCQLPV
jgi:hypothetical protein